MNVNLQDATTLSPLRSNGAAGSSKSLSPGDESKIRHAASKFEAMLLSQWWSAMKEGGLPGGDDDSDPGHDTLDQLGMQAMSTAVANGGGLGIGAILVRSLLSNAGAQAAGRDPAPAQASNSA
jgi:Rod binding domain-containing protein